MRTRRRRVEVEVRDLTKFLNHIVTLLREIGLRYHAETSFPARKPSAGAVPGWWGLRRQDAVTAVRTPPAAFLSCLMLAEAAIELPVVLAVHVAVAVEVEVPKVTGLAGVLPEGGAEEVAVQ